MTKQVHIISLGCSRNLVDSENMAGLLQNSQDYKLSEDPNDSEIIIVNTCGFIDQAKQESIDTILEAAEHKKRGKCQKLIVTGCLSERYPTQLHEEIPEIDLITGTAAFSHIIQEIERLDNNDESIISKDQDRLKDYDLPRVNSQGKHSAYLKLAEGCAKRCSFCIIPKLRGPLRSRSIESLIRETQNLAQMGVREVNLIAQDLTDYGRDRKDGATLNQLLLDLEKIEDIKWLRLFYAYPDQLDESTIDIIRDSQKICHYLDAPIQHISDKILTRMNRHTDAKQVMQMLDMLKNKIPDIVIRTSLMVGFPGETEEDFNALANFVSQGYIDQLGVFSYSHEEGTPSFRLPDNVPSEVKEERKEEIYKIQARVLENKLKDWVGRELEVLIEGTHEETDLLLAGRHYGQAPDIDNKTYINKGWAEKGQFAKVRIEEVLGTDLLGEIIS